MLSAIIFLAACALSFALIWALRCMPAAAVFADSPEKPQAMHSHAVPRFGGIGITCAFVVVACVAIWLQRNGHANLAPAWAVPLASALALVGVVSIVDDFRNVSALVRLVVHSIAAILVVSAVWPMLGAIGSPAALIVAVLCVLAVAWSVNLFNFMDGVNGMVALSSAAGLLSLALLAGLQPPAGAPNATIMLCIAAAGAAAGFLPHNLSGRVFMGDLGSTGLGLLAAALSLIGTQQALWAWWVPLVIFAPMIADTAWTLFRRAIRGEQVWKSHREHIYQRLVWHRGWSHLQVTLLYAGLTLVGALAIAVSKQGVATGIAVEPILPLVWVLKYVSLVVIAEAYLRKVAQS